MSIVRVGATKQYSDNWTNIFGGGGRKASTNKAAAKSPAKSPKKSAKSAKPAGKKKSTSAKRKGN
jgi:hypothetical protein